jgi:hypothetical protein
MRRNNNDKEMCQDYFKYESTLRPFARNAMYKSSLLSRPHVIRIHLCRSELALTDHILLNRAYRDCKKEWVCPPKISKLSLEKAD